MSDVVSGVKLLREYRRAPTNERRRIWKELINPVLEHPKDSHPSRLFAIAILLDEKDKAKDNTYAIIEKAREIIRDKKVNKELRKMGIDFLNLSAYKERSLKGYLISIDLLYEVLRDRREDIEIKKSAGLALIKLGAKWLTRRIVGTQELLEWVGEKRREVGKIEGRNEDLEEVIKRWEDSLQGNEEEKLLASVLLSLMDKYSLLNAKRLLGILRERKPPKDEVIAKWYEIVMERIERISKGEWTEEDIKDIASETSPEELSKIESIYQTTLRKMPEFIRETFSRPFSGKEYKHKG